MSQDEDGEFAENRRSRRANASNSKIRQQNVLEELKQARATGKAYRKRVDDLVEDLYVEVDEAEYEAKKREHRSFVENDGADYYDEDDSEDEFEEEERVTKKSKKNKKDKAKAGTIKHHFQVVTSKQKAQDENSLRVDDDDILKECLADIIGTDNAGTSDSFDPFSSELAIASNFVSVTNSDISSPTVLNKFRVPSPSRIELDEDVSSPVEAVAEKPIAEGNAHWRSSLHAPSSPLRPLSPFPMPFSPASPLQQQKRKDADVHSPKEMEGKRAKVARVESFDLLKFFFIDAYEDAFRNPGKVYLFGRVRDELNGTFATCCLALKNISRQLFFIRREKSLSSGDPVTEENLQNEVRTVLKTKFAIRNIKCKSLILKKLISADVSVPKECQALEVCVNWNNERFPSDFSGDCFSHVMNTTATALERLIIECELHGPCWLSVQNAVLAESSVSYCPLEYNVDMDEMKSISMDLNNSEPPPPINLISMNVLTALNPETKESQIVMISFIEHNCNLEKSTNFDAKMMLNKRFCVVAKLKKGLTLPFDLDTQLRAGGIDRLVRKVGNEVSLLNMFLMKLEETNPDLILGHDLNAQLLLIQAAIERHKLQRWDRLGRLKRGIHIQRMGHSKSACWELTAGRLCLDSKTTAMEMVRARSYEMEELVVQLLKVGNRVNPSIEQISEPFLETNPTIKLVELIKWNWNENFFSMKIVEHFNAIPLFVQITQIVGGVMSRTLMGGRAERNEYLLLHACFKSNYLPPDKRSFASFKETIKSQKHGKELKDKAKEQIEVEEIITEKGAAVEEENADNEMEVDEMEEEEPKAEETKPKKGAKLSKKGPQYTGGLVLEPMKGLYETFVVLLDFNSLYPTIIQEFNICFTTVDSAFDNLLETELPTPPGSSRPDGLLKTEIRKLVNKRKEVKEKMSKEKVGTDKYKQYNIRQMGLKLTANSLYGCLGFQNSRFCAKTLAAMITAKGRELLLHAKSIVENENFSVIYGDTDSIMVNTNSTDFGQAKQIAQKLKHAVNRNFSLLELEIDGIYKRLLLLKKKKYAALVVDMNDENVVTQELKGLDIVRRDWSKLAKEIGEEVVNLLLSSVDRDTLIQKIRAILAERRADIETGRIPLEKFEILKQLTRNPSEYKDTKAQPHALVAIRLNESKKFRLRQGDILNYIICTDGTSNPATQRAYHPSEILADENLSVDVHYYLAHQIHPVVSRLCEPIEEIDACQIAEIIGLDPTIYRQRHTEQFNKIDLAVIFAPFSSK